jgi:hypothetical protein
MIALGVLTVGFLGMLTLLANSLGLNRVVSDTYTANYLAMEGIELVKNTIDANIAFELNLNLSCEWDEGLDAGSYGVDWELPLASMATCPGREFREYAKGGKAGRFLRFDAASGRYGYDGSVETPFTRRVEIVPDPTGKTNGNELKVNSIVEWTTRGGGKFSVDIEDHFYNWARR